MNKRVFSKEALHLNCCTDRVEFLGLLAKLHADTRDSMVADVKVLAVMDHMVERDIGYSIVEYAQQMNKEWGIDLKFVRLSSTEGKDTQEQYKKRGVN